MVEDDQSVRDFAAAILEETDLDMIACDSAADALAVMRERGSEVALLFMEMQLSGEIDGATLARTVERDWPDVRLVVTSRPGEAQAVPDHAVSMEKPWQPLDVLVEAVTDLRRKSA